MLGPVSRARQTMCQHRLPLGPTAPHPGGKCATAASRCICSSDCCGGLVCALPKGPQPSLATPASPACLVPSAADPSRGAIEFECASARVRGHQRHEAAVTNTRHGRQGTVAQAAKQQQQAEKPQVAHQHPGLGLNGLLPFDPLKLLDTALGSHHRVLHVTSHGRRLLMLGTAAPRRSSSAQRPTMAAGDCDDRRRRLHTASCG